MGRKKYETSEKVAIVEQVVRGKMSLNEASEKIGAHKGDIQKWVSAYEYHGVAGLERDRISYTGAFKQMVVEDMRNSGLSQRETAAKYNIAVHDTVGRWERVYLEEGPEGLHVERRGKKSTGRPRLPKPVEEDLLAEVQRLRAEVDYLKKLNALVLEKGQKKRKPR